MSCVMDARHIAPSVNTLSGMANSNRVASTPTNVVNDLSKPFRMKDPKALKLAVETLGFQHMESEVTTSRVITFRDAMVNLLEIEAAQHVIRIRMCPRSELRTQKVLRATTKAGETNAKRYYEFRRLAGLLKSYCH